MRSIAALLVLGSLTGCATPEAPPSAVEVKVAVPVACQEERVPEPVCTRPAYNQARQHHPMDDRVKLLRAEAIEQADCLRQYKDALAACRRLPEREAAKP
jgi:hypothetical protein